MIINFRSCPLLEIIRWLFHSIYNVDLAQNVINMFLDLYTMKCFGSAVWIYKHWCSLKNVGLLKFYIILQRQLSRPDYAHTVLCRIYHDSNVFWLRSTCALYSAEYIQSNVFKEEGTCYRQCIWHVKHISWHAFLNIKHGGMKSWQAEPQKPRLSVKIGDWCSQTP